MADSEAKVFPVILSGGSGTRLWPQSRSMYPKQFLRLTSDKTLLQETLERVRDKSKFEDPLIISNKDHRFIVGEQAEEINCKLMDIVLEPCGRNTAPAVACAAAVVLKECQKRGLQDGLVLILASDHHIADPEAFVDAVMQGVPAALEGRICTFGIKPDAPETGYGYVKRTTTEVTPGVFRIDSFKEKPQLELAKQYVADETYSWNSGMFLFSAAAMLEEMNKHEPSIAPSCTEAVKKGKRDLDFLRLEANSFNRAKSISVDFAVMEHTDMAAMIPLDCGWTDVGSWSSLYSTLLPEGKEIVTRGDCHHKDVKNCFMSTDGPALVAIGVEDLCMVATEDAVLVLPMDRCQDVGGMVKAMKKDNEVMRQLSAKHLTEYKPWGHMKRISKGERYNVHELTLKPGGAISRHRHFHRAEHWVVVSGTATVTYDNETFILQENQSTFIPLGVEHQLKNQGRCPLIVIEVQSGGYLDKGDIVRLDDSYGRTISPYGNHLRSTKTGEHRGGAVTPRKAAKSFPRPTVQIPSFSEFSEPQVSPRSATTQPIEVVVQAPPTPAPTNNPAPAAEQGVPVSTVAALGVAVVLAGAVGFLAAKKA